MSVRRDAATLVYAAVATSPRAEEAGASAGGRGVNPYLLDDIPSGAARQQHPGFPRFGDGRDPATPRLAGKNSSPACTDARRRRSRAIRPEDRYHVTCTQTAKPSERTEKP